MDPPSIDEIRDRLHLLEALFWELLDYVPPKERKQLIHFYSGRWRYFPPR